MYKQCLKLSSELNMKLCQFILASALLFVLFSSTYGFSYGPSIYSLTKAKPTENDTGPSYKKTAGDSVYLSDYAPTFSVLLPLVDGKPFVNESEALSYFNNLHHGDFHVIAPDGWGISAVVQILWLAKVFGAHKRCLDYIQFTEEIAVNRTRSSPKICGIIEPSNSEGHTPKLIGPRSFVSNSSNLTIEIFIFSSDIHSEWTIRDSRLGNTITVEISFTAFPLNDNPTEETEEILELLSNSTVEMVPCLQFEPSYEKLNLSAASFNPCKEKELGKGEKESLPKPVFCIHEDLFCDGIIHCPSKYTSHFHASDEKINCSSVKFPVEEETEEEDEDKILQMWRDKRLIPKIVKQVQPINVQIAHWSIIGVGLFVLMVFFIGLARHLRNKRNSSRSNVGLERKIESKTEISVELEGPEAKKQLELIERMMKSKAKAEQVWSHGRL